jgi:hypothetical protein
MNKVIEDGKVAVLYSPGFGAGWFTWNHSVPECLFDPDIIQLVRDGARPDEIEETARAKWAQGEDEDHFYPGGADALSIEWLQEGTKFFIDEYDGSEYVVTEDDIDWLTA